MAVRPEITDLLSIVQFISNSANTDDDDKVLLLLEERYKLPPELFRVALNIYAEDVIKQVDKRHPIPDKIRNDLKLAVAVSIAQLALVHLEFAARWIVPDEIDKALQFRMELDD